MVWAAAQFMSVVDKILPICCISTKTVPNRGNSRAEEILRVCTSQALRAFQAVAPKAWTVLTNDHGKTCGVVNQSTKRSLYRPVNGSGSWQLNAGRQNSRQL